jgi:hypothetical protein
MYVIIFVFVLFLFFTRKNMSYYDMTPSSSLTLGPADTSIMTQGPDGYSYAADTTTGITYAIDPTSGAAYPFIGSQPTQEAPPSYSEPVFEELEPGEIEGFNIEM